MTKEDLTYIVSILKGDIISHEPEDWHAIMGFLAFHRIEGLFFNRAKKQGQKLPHKVENILRNKFAQQKRRVVFMREFLNEIVKKLSTMNAQYILLKGSVLANLSKEDGLLYEDGERISNDIDILVEDNVIGTISKALLELGYVQGKYDSKSNSIIKFSRSEIINRRMNRGEVAPFVKKTDNTEFPYIEVDINFSLGNTPTEGKSLLKKIVASAQLYKGEIDMNVPDADLFFLHLIMHQYKESSLLFMVQRNKDLDLYKLADIYYILKNDLVDWNRIKEIAKIYQIENALGSVVNQVIELFEDTTFARLLDGIDFQQPNVVDYENKKLYMWTKGIKERLCLFENGKYLQEVKRC